MPRKTCARALYLLSILVASTGSASGEPESPARSGGIYLRGQLGLMGLSAGDDTGNVSGGGVDLGLAVGYHTSTGWVLYGELFGAATTGVDASIDGQSGSCEGDCTLGLGSALLPGLGVGYYTPAGFNLLASLHAPRLTLEVRGDSVTTDRGPVFLLTAGKEWWAGDSFGLGAAIRLGVGSIDELGVGLFSLAFTASYR